MRSRALDEPVDVLYVVGLFRSGSTILDIILGNHAEVASVGELRSLVLIGWGGEETCSCGANVADCAFWGEVRRRWQERVGGDRSERLATLQRRYERLRSVPSHLARWALGSSAALREYGTLSSQLFSAIADVSGKRVIVDSTKYPGRAMALLRTRGVRLHVVHLVRDGRAVIWSCHRKPNVDLFGRVSSIAPSEIARVTSRQWFWVNLLSDVAVALGRGRALRVRYEDLIEDPRTTLNSIGGLVDLDFSEVADRLSSGGAIEVGHMVAGNRVRHEAGIRLRPDLEWHERLSAEDRRTFWRTAGWLADRYGYSRQ